MGIKNNNMEVILMKNYVWGNKTLHINRQRRGTDGTYEESRDRRGMVLEGIILKPYDRRQSSNPNYTESERRSGFDPRSIFDRRGNHSLWLQSKLRLIGNRIISSELSSHRLQLE